MQQKIKIYICIAIVLLCGIVAYSQYLSADRSSGAVVTVLDVGQGDAIYIRFASGHDMLIDAGISPQIIVQELSRAMPWWDRQLNAVVLTHPDSDHIAGFTGVLEQYEVEQAFDCGFREKNTATFRAVYDALHAEGIVVDALSAGARIDIDADVWIEVLSPQADSVFTDATANDCSLVMLIHDVNATLMLTGDASFEVEEEVIRSKASGTPDLDVDVLKVGHHGSRTSTSEDWLDAVLPETAVISVGADNRYHHPHKSVTDRLEQRGIRTLLTARDGAIECKSNQDTFLCVSKEQQWFNIFD